MNLLGDILNAGDNVDDQEDYGFRGSFFKISPTVIDDYTKKIFLDMQLEKLRPQKNIENNDKKSNERYKINMIDEKYSDGRDQISKNDEERVTDDIEFFKLAKLSSKKMMTILIKNLMKEIGWIRLMINNIIKHIR